MTPASAVSFFNLFWNPAVTPSNNKLRTMYPTPRRLLDPPPFLFPIETIAVPPIIATTCRYSRTEYDAPPRSKLPAITGAIFPDLANVATGNERPLASAREVHAFAVTCEAPEIANILRGMPLVGPMSILPTNPTMTLARASRTWRNQASVNLSLVDEV